jgi:hypothetical protein
MPNRKRKRLQREFWANLAERVRGCFGISEDESRVRGILFEILNETLRFRGIVRAKIMSAAVTDGLVFELRRNLEGFLCAVRSDLVSGGAGACGKGGVSGSFAVNGNVARSIRLVKPGGQDAIVF